MPMKGFDLEDVINDQALTRKEENKTGPWQVCTLFVGCVGEVMILAVPPDIHHRPDSKISETEQHLKDELELLRHREAKLESLLKQWSAHFELLKRYRNKNAGYSVDRTMALDDAISFMRYGESGDPLKKG
jgi:hypothetical protein